MLAKEIRWKLFLRELVHSDKTYQIGTRGCGSNNFVFCFFFFYHFKNNNCLRYKLFFFFYFFFSYFIDSNLHHNLSRAIWLDLEVADDGLGFPRANQLTSYMKRNVPKWNKKNNNNGVNKKFHNLFL